MDVPVPVALGVLVEWCKHDRQNHIDVVANEIAKVLIVPEVESSLGNLRQSVTAFEGKEHVVLLTWKCGLATDRASWVNKGS